MTTPFCPGYGNEPFRSLVESCPGTSVYPSENFRVEWGPVFHRGRLDGAARLLIIGQDPAQHEVIARRILIGTAGRRVQGFVEKLGAGPQYVMVNTFLFSVYGQHAGAGHIDDPAITDYRNEWIKAVLDSSHIEAVVAFGSLADRAWHKWLSSPAAVGRPLLAYRKLAHPTSPEAAGGDTAISTKTMLHAYNNALTALRAVLHPAGALVPYGDDFTSAELPPIPQRDFPAGSPPWMGLKNDWAFREGANAADKRFNIRINAAP